MCDLYIWISVKNHCTKRLILECPSKKLLNNGQAQCQNQWIITFIIFSRTSGDRLNDFWSSISRSKTKKIVKRFFFLSFCLFKINFGVLGVELVGSILPPNFNSIYHFFPKKSSKRQRQKGKKKKDSVPDLKVSSKTLLIPYTRFLLL